MAKKTVTVLLAVLSALLLAFCVFAPVASVAVIPLVCALVYYLSFKLSVAVFPIAATLYFVAGLLTDGFGVFTVAGAVLLAVLVLPRLLRRKLCPLAEIGVCAGVCLAAVCATFGIAALCLHKSVAEVISSQFVALDKDPLVLFAARRNYRSLSAFELGHEHYSAADERYFADVLSAYGKHVADELDGSVLWYLTGFGAFSGGVAALGALALAECRGEAIKPPRLKDMRLGRGYLLGGVLPALAFSLFTLYEPMRPVARTVFNLFITLPSALCAITLLYHTLMRPRGKIRILCTVIFWLVMIACALFWEWGLLILGCLGLADAVADFRRLLDWALR